jgi:L-ribulose-5-phosphate 4-epimerase
MEKNLNLKKEIIEKCLELKRLGYFIGTWGNISVRITEGMLITPSKLQYELLQTDDIVTILNEGTIISENNRLPSSEMEAHKAILQKRNDIVAIIHCHSPFASAVSIIHKSIPPFVEDLAQIIGGEINCTKYVPGGQHKKLAEEIKNTIGPSNAVLVANHGVFCCGRDLEEAFIASQIVEKAALMMLTANSSGSITSIPKEFVTEERHRYLHHYGNESDFSSDTFKGKL